MARKRLRSPIKWFGGKGNMVTKILKYVPKHTYYLEAFGGGANLLFAKEPAPFEVYNDLDGGLVHFFKILRDKEKFNKLYKKVCLTPYSRETYIWCRANYKTIEDDIERAWAWYILARWSFGGHWGAGFGYVHKHISRGMPAECSKWLSIIEMLPEIHARIMPVQIEHLDWKACMDKYDWEFSEGFYYLDPPYMPDARRAGGYTHEMTSEQHEELIDYLLTNQHKKRVMLSGYDNPIYTKLEQNGWRKASWEVSCHAAGRTRDTGIQGKGATRKHNQRRIECIWINYDPNEAQNANLPIFPQIPRAEGACFV